MASRAEMLALKNNDVCACFDVMISDCTKSRGGLKSCPRRCSFFLSKKTAFFFLFLFLFYNAFGLLLFSSYMDQC